LTLEARRRFRVEGILMRGPRYRLFDDIAKVRLGLVADVRGFFGGSDTVESWFDDSADEMPSVAFDVLGLVPDLPLRAAIEAAGGAACDLDEISLEVLGSDGEPIGFYQLLSAELELTGRSTDGSLAASVVAWITGSVPHVDAEPVWDAWRLAPPAARNLWARLPAGPKSAWLQVVSAYRPNDPLRRGEHRTGPSGRPEVVLDGRHVTDLTSFYCAIGEAVNGPGGYFGSNPMALTDCLRGGWGVDREFTLVWEHADVARANLGEHLDVLLRVFREAGTDVVLR
jgi:RNAse (barnase) inhibitor barstar